MKAILIITAIVCVALLAFLFIRLCIYQARRVRQRKRDVRAAMNRWLLETPKSCEDDTDTWLGPEMK